MEINSKIKSIENYKGMKIKIRTKLAFLGKGERGRKDIISPTHFQIPKQILKYSVNCFDLSD